MRRKSKSRKTRPIGTKHFTPEQLAKQFSKQRAAKADRLAKEKVTGAIRKFRPRKNERGTIVFIDRFGKRLSGRGRTGFVVSVGNSGKTHQIPQYDGRTGKVEKWAKPRKISDVDVSRLRSKSAKRKFLEAHTREESRGIAIDKSRYGYRKNFRRLDITSEFATYAAKKMLKMLRGTASIERSFSLMIGVTVQLPDGRLEFYETQISTLPGDIRKGSIHHINLGRLRAFFGLQVYAFIARELSSHGYVMAGSANYIKRLKENKRKRRSKWTKAGQEWQGRDKADVEIKSVEWRFLQNTFTQR